jgi:ligand-binding SRPBCC domain-containing protein
MRPVTVQWHARITILESPLRFVDVQEQGPFRSWRHTYAVIQDETGAVLVDGVEFRVLPGWLGRLIDATIVAARLRLLFAMRHQRHGGCWRPGRTAAEPRRLP